MAADYRGRLVIESTQTSLARPPSAGRLAVGEGKRESGPRSTRLMTHNVSTSATRAHSPRLVGGSGIWLSGLKET